MSASPEFFKPAAPVFSPACATPSQLPLPVFGSGAGDDDYFRTPTGSGISYLREPITCPPAPKKPPPPSPMCKKRLFQHAHSSSQAKGKGDKKQPQPADSSSVVPAAVISLRLDELERIFRPHPPPATTATTEKRRRSSSAKASASASDNKQSS